MLATQQERIVVSGGIGQNGKSLRINHEHFVAVPVLGLYIFVRQQTVFGFVRTQGKGFLVMERLGCHNLLWLVECFQTAKL